MEELLSEKNYICKPMSGLKNNCKLLIGFNPLTCKLFLGRGSMPLPTLKKKHEHTTLYKSNSG